MLAPVPLRTRHPLTARPTPSWVRGRQTIRYRGIQVENGGKLFGDIQFATDDEV